METNERERIVQELKENFLVEAGAGSGKTTTMLERIVNLIEQGTDINSICAITYNKAAADNLTNKLIDMLKKRAEDANYTGFFLGESTDEKRNRDKAALGKLIQYKESGRKTTDSGFFGTMDSFCYRILMKYKEELGITKELTIKRDTASISKVFQDNYEKKSVDKICRDFFQEFSKEDGKEIFMRGMNILLDNSYVDFVFPEDNAYDMEENEEEKKYIAAMLFFKHSLQAICYEKKNQNPFTEYITFMDCKKYVRQLLRESANHEDGSKRGKIIEEIGGKYKHYFIDEYQDTDPIQTEIFFFLTSEKVMPTWDACKPKKGSLFIVGDPKQSIYRFRGADPRVFYKVKELFHNGAGEVLELTANYRSKKELIEYYNKAFRKIFKDTTQEGRKLSFLTASKKIKQFDFPKTQCSFSEIEIGEKNQPGGRIDVYAAKHECGTLQDTDHDYYRIEGIIDLLLHEKPGEKYKLEDILVITSTREYAKTLQKHFYEDKNWKSHILGESIKAENKMYASKKSQAGPIEIKNMSWNSNDFATLGVKQDIYDILVRRGYSITNEEEFWDVLAGPDFYFILAEGVSEEEQLTYLYYELKQEETYYSENTSLEKTDDRITISTIHQAKGIESKVVFLANSYTPMFYQESSVDYFENKGVIFGIQKNKKERYFETKCETFDYYHILENKIASEEYDRLSYVAATRAREWLFICDGKFVGNNKPGQNRWMKLIEQAQ